MVSTQGRGNGPKRQAEILADDATTAESPVFPAAQPGLGAADLSALARSFWAKSGDSGSWLSVVQHLMDAADVAGLLFETI